MKIKLRNPFKSKKISLVPTEEDLVTAKAFIDEYPILTTNSDIQTLVANKFITLNGAQLQPAKFLDEIAAFIEKGEPKSKEDLILFVEQKLANVPAPLKVKKKGLFTWFRRRIK